jgi:hypothetical protein
VIPDTPWVLWEHFSSLRLARPDPSPWTRRAARETQENPCFPYDEESGPARDKEKDCLKVKEQSGNVIENKALHFLVGERSRNVVEKIGG